MTNQGSRITVLGNGGWGTAIAILLCEAGHTVSVWGHDDDEIEAIRNAGENELYLKGVPVPGEIE